MISRHEGLSDPCICAKYAHKNGCHYRVAGSSAASTANAKEVIVVKTLYE